jgi:putative protease
MMEIDEDQYGTYIMNSRDLCAIEFLPELIQSGVESLKVEGRNKTIYYAAITARAYRMAIEAIENESFDEKKVHELLDEVFTTNNRGYIPGFLAGNPKEMAQEYEKRQGYHTHDFAGVVRNRNKNRLEIECKTDSTKGTYWSFVFPIKKMIFQSN